MKNQSKSKIFFNSKCCFNEKGGKKGQTHGHTSMTLFKDFKEHQRILQNTKKQEREAYHRKNLQLKEKK